MAITNHFTPQGVIKGVFETTWSSKDYEGPETSFDINHKSLNVQQHILETEHGEIFYTITEPEKESIGTKFIVHGASECSELYDDQIKQFVSEGYRVVTLDLPGHGRSYRMDDINSREPTNHIHNFTRYTESLNAVFFQVKKDYGLNDPKRISIIAHSAGAHPVFNFVANLGNKAEEFISSAILISPYCGANIANTKLGPINLDAWTSGSLSRILARATAIRRNSSPWHKLPLQKDRDADSDQKTGKKIGSTRYATKKRLFYTKYPELDPGPNSNAWIYASAEANKHLQSNNFAHRLATAIKSGIQLVIIQGENDNVVSVADTKRLITRTEQYGASIAAHFPVNEGHCIHRNDGFVEKYGALLNGPTNMLN